MGDHIVAGVLLVPAMVWAVCIHAPRFGRRERSGAVLGFVAMFVGVLSLWALGVRLASWTFTPGATQFHLVPMDLAVGAAILVGALPCFVLQRFKVGIRLMAGLAGTVALSWLPVVTFASMGAQLVFGAATAAIGAAAILLATLTSQDRMVCVRSVLQLGCWTVFVLWFVPSVIMQSFGYGWQRVTERTMGENALMMLPSVLPYMLICAALLQFAREGDGTGFPYDPPKRLVTGGVYAYISNPMQLGIVGLLTTWSWFTGVLWVLPTALFAVLLFVLFKDVCNGAFSLQKTDRIWMDYQTNVPRWRPRLTPWVRPC